MSHRKVHVLAVMMLSAASAVAQNAAPTPASVPASTVAAPQYEPFTLSRRYQWAAWSPVSTQRLAGNAVSSALSTWRNRPPEYGPHWEGYGKRIGIRVASGATGSFLEASIGALWGEDPRYVRAAGQPFKKRLAHVVKMSFMARNRNGEFVPAYARFISVPANSFLTNSFRADGETDTRSTVIRIPIGFMSRAIGNAFTEFWPDVTKRLRRH